MARHPAECNSRSSVNLHIFVFSFQDLADLLQLLICIGHVVTHLLDAERCALASRHILALSVDQVLCRCSACGAALTEVGVMHDLLMTPPDRSFADECVCLTPRTVQLLSTCSGCHCGAEGPARHAGAALACSPDSHDLIQTLQALPPEQTTCRTTEAAQTQAEMIS